MWQIAENLDAAGRCKECAKKAAIEIRTEKYCEFCGKTTPHNGKICLICHPESAPNGVFANFIIKNNVRYCSSTIGKDKELTQLCDDLLSSKEDINDYTGFKICLGRITYNRKDVLTDESILFDINFQIKTT